MERVLENGDVWEQRSKKGQAALIDLQEKTPERTVDEREGEQR